MGKAGGIGVNASVVGENPTGLGLYSVNIVRELDRLREDLVVFASFPEAFGPLRAGIRGVPAATRPGRGFPGHVARLLWLQSVLRVRAWTARLGAILNTVPEGILGCPIPQVTVVHDLLPLYFPAEYPRQQYYFRFLVPRILRASRIVVADSESTRRSVIERYGVPPAKVRVVHPGYDAGVFYSNGFDPFAGGQATPYFLNLGNLLPHKNLLCILDALAILRRRQPCRLIIRGEGRPAYERPLRERVETLSLTDAVTFLGYTPETVMLLHLVPLIQTAWAEGGVSQKERDLIVKAARSRGITEGTPCDQQLSMWLSQRPSDEMFEKSLRAIRTILEAQSPEARKSSEKDLLSLATAIAGASGGIVGFRAVSEEERQILAHISDELKKSGKA